MYKDGSARGVGVGGTTKEDLPAPRDECTSNRDTGSESHMCLLQEHDTKAAALPQCAESREAKRVSPSQAPHIVRSDLKPRRVHASVRRLFLVHGGVREARIIQHLHPRY